jgi:hypothetical protein
MTWLSGVEMYIVPSTTIGLVSKACGTPVLYFHASLSPDTFAGVSCVSGEYRWFV